MYNVHLTHSLLCFEFVEFTLIYFKFRKYSDNIIKKAKEFDNSMIINILMSPNKQYSTL